MSEKRVRGHPAGKKARSLLAPDWQDRAKKTMVYGLLSDAYDAYTAPKRAYQGLLDPMSDEAIGNMADLAGMVTLGAGAIPAEKNTLRAGIKAYHGSPHDFDKFSMDKIGTGEGAQAYGHGLYFAENEGVAQGYRQALAPITASEFDLAGIPPKHWNAATMFARQADETQYKVAARDFANWTGTDLTPEVEEAFRKTLQKRGRMYEVNINANPDDFLDWDKPLSEQVQGVHEGLKKMWGNSYERRVSDPYNSHGQDLAARTMDPSSGRAYTDELKQAGIPGIKYLDQGSRAAGEGSRNYVVFDESLIEIVRKYGLIGALSAGLITEQQAQAFMGSGGGMTQGDWEKAYNAGTGA